MLQQWLLGVMRIVGNNAARDLGTAHVVVQILYVFISLRYLIPSFYRRRTEWCIFLSRS